jgi:conjugative relaxase-like TrwC/TraI family protein
MVSITGVTGCQASHYYTEKDNYYSKEQGEWYGKGAAELGLAGPIEKEVFEDILAGKSREGDQLVGTGVNGEHRAGIDVTFSAPKSVSILSEACDEGAVRQAHREAVDSTLRHIEEHYAQARQTEKGQTERIDTGNLVIAKFEHDTSRELDPQLHTHAVIMNMTQREDGQWRALSNEELYNNKMYFGQYYRNELAANLRERGYEIESDHRGLFEVRGIDKDLRDHFSQRSEQIADKVKEMRTQYPHSEESKLREIAALGSRIAKQDVDKEAVHEAWNERLRELEHTIEGVIQNVHREAENARQKEQERTEPRLNEYDYIRIAARDLTENESTFSKESVLRNAGRLSVGQYRTGDLGRAFDELRSDKEIRRLDRNTFTTSEMQKIEKDIVRRVRHGQDKTESVTTPEKVQAGLKEYEQVRQRGNPEYSLTEGQRRSVEHILTSRDKYVGIQGDAGTGKSTMLGAVRQQAQSEGYEVRGLAKTGKAAEELEKNAGIRSQTIDSFLLQERDALGERQLWVIDEASMVGSRQFRELMIRSEQAEAKVVYVGDHKQEQAIDAGVPFQKLQESGVLKTVEMNEITRQSGEYRETSQDLAARRIDRAFGRLARTGKINEMPDRAERIKTIVEDYTGRPDYKDTIIVTARNDDRTELNDSIRKELKSLGRLDEKEYTFTVRASRNLSPEDRHFGQSYREGDVIYSTMAGVMGRAGSEGKVTSVDHHSHSITAKDKDGKEHSIDLIKDGGRISVYGEKEASFSEGDKVIFLKNDRGLEVKNGQCGTVRQVDELGHMSVQMESGREVEFNVGSQYNYIDHGYAVTSYKSQGQTSRDVIYHADTRREVNFNQAYVAITRGREDVAIYTDDKENLKDQMKNESMKTWSPDYETSPDFHRDQERKDFERSEMNESSKSGQDDSHVRDSAKDQEHDIEK